MTAYVFGDNDIAAQRLRLLAEIYDASTRAFVREWAQPHRRAAKVMDLGCGLGYTTRLLAEELHGEQTLGLDTSESFIAAAQRESRARVKVTYVCHDVTQVPFPSTPVDVLFCRLLLTHIAEPTALIASWSTQLRPGGVILMEEVEWIRTNSAVFTTYLDMQRELLLQAAVELPGYRSDAGGLTRAAAIAKTGQSSAADPGASLAGGSHVCPQFSDLATASVCASDLRRRSNPAD